MWIDNILLQQIRLNIRNYFMSSESSKQQLKKSGNVKGHIHDDEHIGHFFLHQVHFIFTANL